MSVFHTRPGLRWLVPTSVAVAIVGGGVAVGTFAAAAEPDLPERSAAQLLVDLQTARLDGLTGTVLQRADLGLPTVPGVGERGGAGLSALLSGTHTIRVWYAGPDRARVAVLGTLGETDVIRNGSDVWVWNSQTKHAQHTTLPGRTGAPEHKPAELRMTPQEAAEAALAAIDPSTQVRVGRSTTVADRDAYELVLDPRDGASLVDEVRIAVDAVEHVPLAVKVFATGRDKPAFELAFTQVDFNRPDPTRFVFNPPPGTRVTEEAAPEPGTAARAWTERLRTVGQGWTTVLVAQAPQLDRATAGQPDGGDSAAPLGRLLNQLPEVSGEWGSGRLVRGDLFNVLLTDDGRVLVGAVTPERLYEVAGTTR